MKKLLCVLVACALCAVALSGCGSRETPDAGPAATGVPSATELPAEGEHGETDQSAALEALPTLAPAQTLSAAELSEGVSASGEYYSIDAVISDDDDDDVYVDDDDDAVPADGEVAPAQTYVPVNGALNPSVYQYSALVDTSLGFTFNYPSHWKNVPGVYTVCYREDKSDGSFPARVAITAKKLVHSPEGSVLTDELTSYMKTIYKQYEPNTFQAGVANSEDVFMGKQAHSNTYLAYSGETEVKGFVIGRAVKRVLYVFHFCASYEDYQAMEGIMRYMLNSVQLVEED